ncbi:glycerate kinase type-2 family protein [Telmatobacter bradus]|uniref:glycerate kinase type-2 family protein n=1 Tax=Telmatobacter bradus TaxID=474953 RepID=UPI003B42C84D
MTPVGDIAIDALHAKATEIYEGALEACNIGSAFDRRIAFDGNTLRRLLPDGGGPDTIDISAYKRIFIVSIGKAAEPMLQTLFDRLKRRKGIRGICCSPQMPAKRSWRIRYFEGGHPLPNDESMLAARAALNMLRKARKDTLVFFLISGGGSAMFDLPLDTSISLEDTRAFHQALLLSGAPINEVNTLRKHFSAVKAGRLAMAAPEATKVNILLPDVPLRTLDALSSGPTSPDHSTVDDVRTLMEKYHLAEKFPPAVRAFFERTDLPESPGNKSWVPPIFQLPLLGKNSSPRTATSAAAMSGEDEIFRDSVYEVLLSAHDLGENARHLAEKAGYTVFVDNSCDDWDYKDAARYLMERFHALRAVHKRLCLISVGEVTVTINKTPGAGGRNQQFVMACALDLERHPGERLTVLSAGSDGIDGNTQVAGAIADPTTVERAHTFGFHLKASLAAFNACPMFTALGDAVVTGPTGHNLRDIRLLIAERD